MSNRILRDTMRAMRSAEAAGRCARGIAIVVAILLSSPPALALNPALDVTQYAHTTWRNRDGFARASIRSIAQTPDGYLWLATEFGLLRFDGVKSVAWQPPPGQRLPSTEIYRLLAARDGSLWIATSSGLARWKDGRLTEVEQLAGQIVMPLAESRDGKIWAGTIAIADAKICEIEGSSARCDGAGRLGNVVIHLHEDSSGSIWAAVANGLWQWRPGPPRFHPMPGFGDGIRSLVDYDGGLLIGTASGLQRLVGGNAYAYVIPGIASQSAVRALLRDRDGSLWIGTADQGLVHVHQGRSDVFGLTQGLSANQIEALFEDREGSIWVATGSGLDRFREVAVPMFGARQSVSDAPAGPVLAARDGSIWFGANGVLNQRKSSLSTIVPTTNGRPIGRRTAGPNAVLQDQRGRIWVSTLDGSGYFENDRYVPERHVPAGVVHALADDADGNIWVANQREGLFQVAADGTTRQFPWPTFGRKDFATALVADSVHRGLWVGFQNGGLIHFDRGEVRASYTAAEGLGAGRINGLRFDRHGALWAATAGGLSRLHNGRLSTLTIGNGLPCDPVHWAVEDDAQSVWLYMPCGLVRIPVSDLEAWTAEADSAGQRIRTVRSTLFDSADGVTTVAIPYGSSPLVAKSVDGKIWFASAQGLSVIDPRRLPFNDLPPPVQIEQIIADRTPYPVAEGSLKLPALTRDLQIDYTALSLVAPEKMRFRYKLEGHDEEWQDVGARRQAFYNDLRPGSYRFRVTASNNSGVWNETGTFLDFLVAPAYYQTAWFQALAAAAIVMLVWGAHRLRLRVVERHEREITALNERLMKAQEQERIRIAGELHDGVMQEMLAVTMMLGTAKRRVGEDSDAKATLDKIQEKMIRVGADIRRVSHDLHPPSLQQAGLPGALQAYCDEFATGSGISITCEADEEACELSRGAALALFRITQEAVGNATKHAAARHITVRLKRANGAVSLEVSDDGVGFDRNRLSNSGGLGLITMRERAGQLNGTFDFESAPGHGTTIKVMIPFR